MAENKDWLGMDDWILKKVRTRMEASAKLASGGPLSAKDLEKDLNYQIFLEEASRSMIRFRKPEHLIRMIVKTIDEQVRTTHTAMLVHSHKKNYYHLIDSKGTEGSKIPVGFIKLSMDNPLVRIFYERLSFRISDSGALQYDELIDLWQNDEGMRKNDRMMELIPGTLKEMKLLKVNVCVPIYYKKDLFGVFLLGKKLSKKEFSRQEISFFTTLANDVAMALSNARLIQQLHEKIMEVHVLYEREHSMFIHTAISLAAAIDARDPYTHGHTERVTSYSLSIADELEELPEAREYLNFKETLHISALLHDVGKVGVPDNILNKAGQLTKEEFEKIKEHTITGATILYPIRELGDVATEVRAHHERWDGSGYPDGLKGEEIPFIARIISVADAFDAITSDRPYRQRKMSEVAAQIISENSGTQFDPVVASAFLLAYKKGKLGNHI